MHGDITYATDNEKMRIGVKRTMRNLVRFLVAGAAVGFS